MISNSNGCFTIMHIRHSHSATVDTNLLLHRQARLQIISTHITEFAVETMNNTGDETNIFSCCYAYTTGFDIRLVFII
jgi:hypothetical protein